MVTTPTLPSLSSLIPSDQTLQGFQDSYSDYVVAPLLEFGIGGFQFDVEDGTDVDLSADITDHYVEDNSAVQDHVATRPKRLTLNSRVGELVYIDENEFIALGQSVARKLVTLEGYLPLLSKGAAQARQLSEEGLSALPKLSDVSLDDVSNLWALAKNLNPAATKQQKAYLYFKAVFEKRIPISVQTPFGYMQDMIIEGISASQGDNAFVSSFSISLKELRTVSLQLVAFDASKYQSRGAEQISAQTDNGSTSGEQRNSSTLFDIFSSVGGNGT